MLNGSKSLYTNCNEVWIAIRSPRWPITGEVKIKKTISALNHFNCHSYNFASKNSSHKLFSMFKIKKKKIAISLALHRALGGLLYQKHAESLIVLFYFLFFWREHVLIIFIHDHINFNFKTAIYEVIFYLFIFCWWLIYEANFASDNLLSFLKKI